jgi:hypothetical protein
MNKMPRMVACTQWNCSKCKMPITLKPVGEIPTLKLCPKCGVSFNEIDRNYMKRIEAMEYRLQVIESYLSRSITGR